MSVVGSGGKGTLFRRALMQDRRCKGVSIGGDWDCLGRKKGMPPAEVAQVTKLL